MATGLATGGTSGGTGANSVEGSGANSHIWINKNGPFFKSSGIVDFKMQALYVAAGYQGGALRTQVLILFHELGNMVNLLPADRGNPTQNTKNTGDVLDHCRSQIDQLH